MTNNDISELLSRGIQSIYPTKEFLEDEKKVVKKAIGRAESRAKRFVMVKK